MKGNELLIYVSAGKSLEWNQCLAMPYKPHERKRALVASVSLSMLWCLSTIKFKKISSNASLIFFSTIYP